MTENGSDDYLRAGEVAQMLHVRRETVARWETKGKLPCVHTLGGHRRFPGPQMRELAKRLTHEAPVA